MHRMELKEAFRESPPRGVSPFLMHRMELKAKKTNNNNILISMFLMHRMELKELEFIFKGVAKTFKVPNAPYGVESL